LARFPSPLEREGWAGAYRDARSLERIDAEIESWSSRAGPRLRLYGDESVDLIPQDGVTSSHRWTISESIPSVLPLLLTGILAAGNGANVRMRI